MKECRKRVHGRLTFLNDKDSQLTEQTLTAFVMAADGSARVVSLGGRFERTELNVDHL